MSAPVFLVEAGELAGVGTGTAYLLGGSEGRHAGVVQRRAAGERVDVVDGAGVRLRGRVESVGPDGVVVHVVERVEEPPPDVALVLVQALAKGDRDELAIEAATEVGVDGVLPWQAERSVVVWRGDRAAKSRMRWVGTVRAATKQSRRARVPDVGPAVDTAALAARVRDAVAHGGAALVLHEDAADPIASAPLGDPTGAATGAAPGAATGAPAPGRPAAQTVAPPTAGTDLLPREVLVVVGPEGGISDRELTVLRDAGAVAVRLGPHVLRTSTAGPVAVALLAQRLGRWG